MEVKRRWQYVARGLKVGDMVWIRTLDGQVGWYLCTQQREQYILSHMNGIDAYAMGISCEHLLEVLEGSSDLGSFKIYPADAYEIELVPYDSSYCRREMVE